MPNRNIKKKEDKTVRFNYIFVIYVSIHHNIQGPIDDNLAVKGRSNFQ